MLGQKMDKKCTKYEELFISSDKNALLEHIKICPDCAAEHEKMKKVSGLIKEFFFHTDKGKRGLKPPFCQ